MIYRKEIDGLRALAVLPVIFFHAGFSTFSGGYAGVDVFFVISGYLITSILIDEISRGEFSIANFYERRVRRILPALFLVMFTCLPFAWLWQTPAEMKSFSGSLIAVSGFSSNILFWIESGYFETANELKPLLHTWSLAVEEQYYLFFPLFLLAAWRFGRRWIIAIVIATALLSLLAAQWGSVHRPEANFYLLPTRAWELAIGAFIAFFPRKGGVNQRTSPAVAQLLSAVGLAMIFYSLFTFDSHTPFPGWHALFPTVGAALIIHFASQQNLTGKILGQRILVGTGLISYSAYLWHQPLLAFARLRSFDDPSPLLLASMVVLSLILAAFTLHFVETPFRNRKRINSRGIAMFGITGSVFFILVGIAGQVSEGFANRFHSGLNAAIAPDKTNFEKKCLLRPMDGEPLLRKCEFGDVTSKSIFLVYGDSHAQALYSEIEKSLLQKKLKGVFITNDACMIPGVYDSRSVATAADCERASEFLYRYIAENVTQLAVVIRWSYRLYPIPGAIDTLLFDNGENGIEHGDLPRQNFTLSKEKREVTAGGKRSAIEHFLGALSRTGKEVFLMYPIPEAGWNVPKLNFRSYIERGQTEETMTTSFDVYKRRNEFVIDVLDGFAAPPNFVRIKPSSVLCDTYVPKRCVLQIAKVSLYYDDDHLSNAGAKLVIAPIVKAL